MKKDNTLPNTASDLQNLSIIFRDAARKAEEQARDLEHQARRARDEAFALNAKASILENAHLLVKTENRANFVAPQLDKKLAKTGKNTRVVFLIDGSGSMGARLGSSVGYSYSSAPNPDTETPLAYAIGTAANVSQKVVDNKGKAETLMFGDSNPPWVDLQDIEVRAKVAKGLNSGTDLAPALEKLAKTVKKSQDTHIVILSDGDMFDSEKSKATLQNLLDQNPKLTLGLVEINNRNSPSMSRLISSLATDGREKRIEIQLRATSFEEVSLGVSQLLTNRLAEQEKAQKAAARKRKSPAKPKP